MSRAYELFYANHSLESKMEPCALCFQACSDNPPPPPKNPPFSCLPCHQPLGFFFVFFAPRFSVCVCGPADGRAQLSTANNWRNGLRILEFKMTSTHRQNLSMCATKVCENKLQKKKRKEKKRKNPELSVMILPFLFFFFLPCSAAHEPIVDYFLRGQH